MNSPASILKADTPENQATIAFWLKIELPVWWRNPRNPDQYWFDRRFFEGRIEELLRGEFAHIEFINTEPTENKHPYFT